MKLSTYNPSVQLHNGPDAKVQAFNGGEARTFAAIGDMQGRAAGALVQGINNINAIIIRQQEEADTVNVVAATNDYTKRINELLYNQETGLMNTEMQGASGITGMFEEQEKKIRAEIAQRYKFNTKKGRIAFVNRANESAAQRYALVERHQTKQYNAYKDVTFNNALQLNMQAAADNFTDKEIVTQNINEALRATAAQYYHQGPEVVKAQQKKIAGLIAQQVINWAYANGDNDAAETYIETYGMALDPDVLNAYSKKVYDSRMALLEEDTGAALFAQFGDDGEAAYNHIFSPDFHGAGKSEDSITWMKGMSDKKESWGVNTCTKGVNAALQAGGFKPISVWAPTAWKEEKTFTDKSQLRGGDIVYWESDGGGEPNHVGIYDPKTGMVYQSGGSGFAPIPLNAYKLWGFSHPQGQAATTEERKKMWNAYLERRSLVEKIQADRQKKIKQQAAAIEDNAVQQLYKMQQDGVPLADAEAQIKQMVGMNYEMGKKLRTAANYFWGEDGKPASQSIVADVTNMLADGKFRSREEYLDMAKNKGFSADQMRQAYKTYSQYEAGEGQFGYDLNEGIKQQVVGDVKESSAKQQAWEGVKPLLRIWIQQQLTETKRKPAVYEIVEKGRELIEKRPLGFVRRGLLFDIPIIRSQSDFERNGIKSYSKIDENMYEVKFSNGAVETMSAARFEEISR